MHKRCTAADKVSREAVKLVATIFGRLHSFRGSKIIFVIYKKKKNIKTKTQTKKNYNKNKSKKYNKATDAYGRVQHCIYGSIT